MFLNVHAQKHIYQSLCAMMMMMVAINAACSKPMLNYLFLFSLYFFLLAGSSWQLHRIVPVLYSYREYKEAKWVAVVNVM
jgi:hypothetical protein